MAINYFTLLTVVIFAFLFMTLMWFWGRTRDNYGVIDVGWGLVIALISSIICLFGTGSLYGKLVLLVPIWIWSIRLSGFLYWTRIRTNHPEDKRYAEFRKDYGDKVHQKFFTNVFLLQGVLAMLLSGPAIAASDWDLQIDYQILSSYPGILLGWILFFVGIIGETIADKQLHQFLSVPENRSKVCNVGLWKYTRHPNYFFEWIIWVGIGIIPLRGGSSWISLFTPIFMFVLLRFISGVPFAERSSLKSKGQLFIEYQKSTNAFFPWRNR